MSTQCTGTIRNPKDPRRGQPCKNRSVHGRDRCAVHGGSKRDGALPSPTDLKNRCVAHSSRTGERCKRSAIAGGTVCRTHGGSAKHVQRKARELLDRAVEPAIHQLRDIMLRSGTSDGDRLRAIQMVLDRSGITPGITVEHEIKPWEVMLKGIITTVPAEYAELTPLPEQRLPDGDILEVEIEPEPAPSNVVPIRAHGMPLRAPAKRGSASPPRRNDHDR